MCLTWLTIQIGCSLIPDPLRTSPEASSLPHATSGVATPCSLQTGSHPSVSAGGKWGWAQFVGSWFLSEFVIAGVILISFDSNLYWKHLNAFFCAVHSLENRGLSNTESHSPRPWRSTNSIATLHLKPGLERTYDPWPFKHIQALIIVDICYYLIFFEPHFSVDIYWSMHLSCISAKHRSEAGFPKVLQAN